jgi:hypothetical protein
MTQSETVTLFNDMCLFAPATLVDPAIGWTLIDTHTVDATFTAAGHTIRARLRFNDADELTDFISDDRYRASSDGDAMERWRWSTPIAHYRAYGPARLAAAGEGRWHDAEGDYSYIELAIDDVQYNVGPR